MNKNAKKPPKSDLEARKIKTTMNFCFQRLGDMNGTSEILS